MEVVAFATEDRVSRNVHGDVDVAGLAAVSSRMPFSRHANPRAVREARRHRDRQRLGLHVYPLTVAGRARSLPLSPGTAAWGARLGEHHVPARRLHDPGAVTLRARRFVHVQAAGATTGAAMLLTRDRDRPLAAPDGLVEADRDGLVQVSAALGIPVLAARPTLVQHVGEQVAEGGRLVAADAGREIKSFEPERRAAGSLRGRPRHVVPPAVFGVAERFVRFRDLPKLGRRHAVPGIDVGVILAREPLVGALDVARPRIPLQAQDDVEIHPRYCLPSSTTSASMTSPFGSPDAPLLPSDGAAPPSAGPLGASSAPAPCCL